MTRLSPATLVILLALGPAMAGAQPPLPGTGSGQAMPMGVPEAAPPDTVVARLDLADGQPLPKSAAFLADTITVGRDPQTKELLISGTGQLHVEVVVGRLKKRYKVDVVLHQPKVPRGLGQRSGAWHGPENRGVTKGAAQHPFVPGGAYVVKDDARDLHRRVEINEPFRQRGH